MSERISVKVNQVDNHDEGEIPTRFWSDWVSDSHFIVGGDKVNYARFGSLVTMTQGHRDGCQKFIPHP